MIKITSLFFIFSVMFLSYAYAENDASEGYDENTEITIKGTIKDVIREMRGPVIVLLKTGSKDYKIITAPPWFIVQKGIELNLGKSYEVVGSQFFSRDGNQYLIASRIKDLDTGKITQLRDSSYMPLWKGRRMKGGAN